MGAFLSAICQIDEVLLGNGGDGYGADVFDGNYYAEVLLVALYDADDTGKGALGNLDVLAGLAGKVHVVEKYYLLVGMADDGLDVLHLLVGHFDNLRVRVEVLVVVVVHEVANALIFLSLRLEPPEALQRGAYEQDVAEHGSEIHGGGRCLLECGRDIDFVDGGFLLQLFAHLGQLLVAGMPDSQGEPVFHAFFYHAAVRLWILLGVTTYPVCGGNGMPVFESVSSLYLL